MAFHSYSTRGAAVSQNSKTLIYGIHGCGKTTQAQHYLKRYGRGFIISGESGLLSLSHSDISYLPFSSWEDGHDPDGGKFSFKGICRMMASPEFAASGFNWVMLDSLTELSDRFHEHLQQHPDLWTTKGGKLNPLDLWGKYNEGMIAALKWIRDLPYRVIVSALAKEEKDDNDRVTYWPMVKGAQVGRQIPGMFDNVFGLVKTVDATDKDNVKINRWIVTDEVHGWKCKNRTPVPVLKPVEPTGDVTELLERLNSGQQPQVNQQAQSQPKGN